METLQPIEQGWRLRSLLRHACRDEFVRAPDPDVRLDDRARACVGRRSKGGWIPTRSATPSTALVPQRKVGFPIPNAGLLLGFQGTKTARRGGISSPFSDAGGCTSPQNSGVWPFFGIGVDGPPRRSFRLSRGVGGGNRRDAPIATPVST